jgi:hypothetical protein
MPILRGCHAQNGDPALVLAIKHGHVNIATKLIEMKADVNVKMVWERRGCLCGRASMVIVVHTTGGKQSFVLCY